MASRKFFSAEEKVYLKELVEKNKFILENKKTDCVSATKKKATWETLAKEFNSFPSTTSRTADQLKKCWENMKSRRKDQLSQLKRYRMGTGGGEHKHSDDECIDDILNIVDTEIGDSIDSDTVVLAENLEGNFIVNSDNFLQPASEEQPSLSTNDDHEPLLSTPVNREHVTVAGNNSHRAARSITRGTALDRELELRMRRTSRLMDHDDQMQRLRLEQEKELHLLQKQHMEALNAIELKRALQRQQHEKEVNAIALKREEEKLQQDRELFLLKKKKIENS